MGSRISDDEEIIGATYPAPTVGKEALVLGPVVRINVEHPCSHDENPDGEIHRV